MKKSLKGITIEQVLPWLLILGGAVGLVASIALSIESLSLAKNPHSAAVCDLNPIFSCSSVTSSSQAEVFKFPNPYIGIAAYSGLFVIGLAILAGAKFKSWFWRLVLIGLALAVIFIHWLIFQALYRIGALCLFCMFSWAVTIPMFWYLTLYSLKAGHIGIPKSFKSTYEFLYKHHGDVLLLWFLLIIVLIGKRFWYYWSTLF